MQCPSCHFENMPGQTLCGRCHSNLQLASLNLSVTPPRATVGKKVIRSFTPNLNEFLENTGSVLESITGRLVANVNDSSIPSWRIILRMILPGWAQAYCGFKFRAIVFSLSYFLLLVLGVLYYGTAIGSFYLGLLICVHSASILDLFKFETNHRLSSIIASLVILAVVWTVIYQPIWAVLRAVAEPIMIQTNAPPLQRSDVLLVNHRRSPEPGDVVVYTIPEVVSRTFNSGRPVNYEFRGRQVDRIIAGAGQKVSHERGQLQIDGVASSVLALGELARFAEFNVEVPANHWLIIPSTVANAELVDPLAQLMLINFRQVEGVVYWRSHPFSRMGTNFSK